MSRKTKNAVLDYADFAGKTKRRAEGAERKDVRPSRIIALVDDQREISKGLRAGRRGRARVGVRAKGRRGERGEYGTTA